MSLPFSSVRRFGSTFSSSPRPAPVGVLTHKDHTGKILGRKKIYANHQVVIGRDKTRCQYVLYDPFTSKRHLRIYTVVYENDEPCEVETLVYAEDLSQNGTYWNGAFIGKGNGGFLLSNEDVLRLSRRTYLIFNATTTARSKELFDFIQESEMAKFRQDYVLSDKLLGAGAFGRVIMAIDQNSRRQVACKVVDLRVLMPGAQTRFGKADQPAAADEIDGRVQVRKVKAWAIKQMRKDALERQLSKYYREIDILASINHPNIIGVERAYVTDNTMYIMQEIVTAGDLFSYIESKNGKLLEVEAAVIVRQILVALSFLHSEHIVHRDIKPDNILMTSLAAGCRVVLTDFGAARRIESKMQRMTSIIGTHEYAAPEVLGILKKNVEVERPGYTRAVDMWAVGCVTVVLLTGGLAFCDPITNQYSENLARNCNLEFLHNSTEWKLVRHRPRAFVEQLLILDENARLTADEALKHSWFYNEVHQNDFKDLYQRTINQWKPRIIKSQVLEFQDTGYIRELECSKVLANPPKRIFSRNQPVEPHYKPFPRQMNQILWPPRSPRQGLSDEALLAMELSSPTSAARLRLRASSMSPSSRFPLSNIANTSIQRTPRRNRAASELPALRKPYNFEDKSPAQKSGFFTTKPSTRINTDQQSRPSLGETKPVERPPTPRPQKAHMDTRPSSSTAASLLPTNVSATCSNRIEQTQDAGIGGDQSLGTDNIDELRKTNVSGALTTYEIEQAPEINSESPRSDSKLKRRPSMLLSTPNFKKHRGSSVFDLAEDTSNDLSTTRHMRAERGSISELNDNRKEKSPQLPRSPFTRRPNAEPKTFLQARPAGFYLPR